MQDSRVKPDKPKAMLPSMFSRKCRHHDAIFQKENSPTQWQAKLQHTITMSNTTHVLHVQALVYFNMLYSMCKL
jgi:hypothetical protein